MEMLIFILTVPKIYSSCELKQAERQSDGDAAVINTMEFKIL